MHVEWTREDRANDGCAGDTSEKLRNHEKDSAKGRESSNGCEAERDRGVEETAGDTVKAGRSLSHNMAVRIGKTYTQALTAREKPNDMAM